MKSKLLFTSLLGIFSQLVWAQDPITVSYVTVNPQNGSSEGGEIKLLGAGSNNQILLDNYDGRFRVFNTSEFFSINQSGQVGIGNGGPVSGSKLDVSGTIATNGQLALNSNSTKIWVGDLAGGDGTRILSLMSNDTESLIFNADGNYDVFGGGFRLNRIATPLTGGGIFGQIYQLTNLIGTSDGIVYQSDNHQFRNYDGTPEVTIKDGNVGIGTANPDANLTIGGRDLITYNLKIKDQLGRALEFVSPTASSPYGRVKITGTGSDLRLGVDNYPNQISILGSNGNVGIGITNPTAKLEVDGNIISEEIKVQVVNGPDYVFSPDYELPTLEETKAYIEENQHLPEIPSAAEMEVNGVALGEMNMLLLKKIEELTLYQIHLMQELQSIKGELKLLKDENK